MKTSNSEQMFIDTLRALGLTTDLCEAVNGMRKAVMEAEEAGEGGEKTIDIARASDVPIGIAETEQELIEHYLLEPHRKLAEKLDELEKIENKDEKVKNDINAIEDYYSKCFVGKNIGKGDGITILTSDAAIRKVSRLNEEKRFTEYHWPTFYSVEDADNAIKFLESHEGKASEDVMNLLHDAFKAYDIIWKEMKNHHIVRVPIRTRTRNWTARLRSSGSAYIDLEELLALVPRADERRSIEDVINEINSDKKPTYDELRDIYYIRERCIKELPRLMKIARLEKELAKVSPEAYKKYNEIASENDGDIKKITDETFKNFLGELNETSKESYDIVREILEEISWLDGGMRTREYIQWRDFLNTGAERGETVERDPSSVLGTVLTKTYRSGNVKYGKMGDKEQENTNVSDDKNSWRRESKDWTKVQRLDWKYWKGEKLKELNKLATAADDSITRTMDFIVDITDGETNKTARDLKEYVMTSTDIDDEKVNGDITKILNGINNGEIVDENVIDVNLSNILDKMREMLTECNMLDSDDVEKYHTELSDIFSGQSYRKTGKDIEVRNMASDAIIKVLHFIDSPEEGDKEKANRIIFKCVNDIDDTINDWNGEKRKKDIASTVEKILEPIREKIEQKSKAEKNATEMEEKIKAREDLEARGASDIVKKVEVNGAIDYRISIDGEKNDVTIANRFDQAFDGVEYGAVKFKYGNNYGLWTARNFSQDVGKEVSFGKGKNKYYAGRPVAITGEGSGWLYTFDMAMSICPSGWHIPTMDEWKALVGEYLGKVIENSSMKKAVDGNEGALLLKSKDLNGLDCFDFGIVPTGTEEAIGGWYSKNANTTAYYWCGGVGGRKCIKFDYFNDSATFVDVKPEWMACLRFVEDH